MPELATPTSKVPKQTPPDLALPPRTQGSKVGQSPQQVRVGGCEQLKVIPWEDELLQAYGYDPRSLYVEKFWLGILGPSTTWLMRYFADRFDHSPQGFSLDLTELAKQMGLGYAGGRHSPMARTLSRCCSFDLARVHSTGELGVRARLGPVPRKFCDRMPEILATEHAAWTSHGPTTRNETPDRDGETALLLARSLIALGEPCDVASRMLLRWGFDRTLADKSVSRARSEAAHPSRQHNFGVSGLLQATGVA